MVNPKKMMDVISTYFIYGHPTKSPMEATIANCNPIANTIFTFLLIIVYDLCFILSYNFAKDCNNSTGVVKIS